MLAFCVMVVCLVATLGVTAANLRLTYVTDSNGARQVLLTDADASPAQVMHLSGIRSEEGDEVYYTAFSGNLASLNIERAFSVSITADGQEYPVKLVFGTVADALERAGITLEGDDYTEPALDHVVTAGSKIVVHRVDYAERVETQAIPYDTQYVYTSLYFRNTGRTTTVQHGAAGQQTVTTRDRYVDGELENSTVVDTTTTVEPTDHVIKTYGAGAPVSPLTGADGTTNAPTSYSKVLTGKATGYYSRTGKGSSGLGLGYGTVAVDPDVIPYGTKLYITSTDGKFVYGYRSHRHRHRRPEGADPCRPVLRDLRRKRYQRRHSGQRLRCGLSRKQNTITTQRDRCTNCAAVSFDVKQKTIFISGSGKVCGLSPTPFPFSQRFRRNRLANEQFTRCRAANFG